MDDDYVQVLSLKEPPSQTFAHLLNDLLGVPGNFIAVVQWQPENNSRMRRLIQNKRRYFHHTKNPISSQVTASGPTPSKDVLTDTSAVAFEGELGACLEAMEVGGCQFGQFIHDHRNVLIAGGTGAGKTTLLNALTALIPADERLLIIEDTAEIQVHQPNVVRLEARREQPGLPAVTIRALLKASLRLRPDRILVGEVRGPEAFDLLQALNTGHAGTLATTHADSARLALSRFATCVMTAGVELPYAVVREQIGESLHLVVHLARKAGQRHVTEVVRVSSYDVRENRFELETLYARA